MNTNYGNVLQEHQIERKLGFLKGDQSCIRHSFVNKSNYLLNLTASKANYYSSTFPCNAL